MRAFYYISPEYLGLNNFLRLSIAHNIFSEEIVKNYIFSYSRVLVFKKYKKHFFNFKHSWTHMILCKRLFTGYNHHQIIPSVAIFLLILVDLQPYCFPIFLYNFSIDQYHFSVVSIGLLSIHLAVWKVLAH